MLELDEVEIPDPPAGRVRVRVTAVGLNPADWELCRGFMATGLPRGIGLDVAGVVDAVGEGARDVRPGDPVLGASDFVVQQSAGAADVAILEHWARIPEGLDPVHAAVLPLVVETASWTLDAMGVAPGETLLVHGAGGTVGFAAVQIALARGARVIATAGDTYADDLRGFGAAVTSYGDGMVERVRELAGGPVDHVLDAAPPSVGAVAPLIELVAEPGRVVTISNHDEARRLGARVNLDLIGAPEPFEQLVPRWAARAAEGAFRVPIARTLPLEAWREAMAASMSGHARGKLVLLPGATV